MPDAKLLLEHSFDGAGYPLFAVPWPFFDFPDGGVNGNKGGWTRPVVDGHGHGIASRTVGNVTWRAKSQYGRSNPDGQAEVWARWKNAGFAARREVGLVLRFLDFDNCLIARVRSMGTSNPELRLFKIEGGVSTQLGATYTGAPLNASAMNNGIRWLGVTKDKSDGTGNTEIRLYVASDVAHGTKGTLALSYTGDLGTLRGAFPCGVEIRDLVSGDDVYIDELRAFDLSDEWDPSGGVSTTTGWQVELGSTLYSLDQLKGLIPGTIIVPTYCRQAYSSGGGNGNEAELQVRGDWRAQNVIYPGLRVRFLHGGVVRFAGRVGKGQLRASPQEVQTWTLRDAMFLARDVKSLEDDGTSAHDFNVYDTQGDKYRASRQNMTHGQILAFLFTTYDKKLRALGAAPASGSITVSTELDALDSVLPDVSLRGSFGEMIFALLRWQPAVLPWVDPVTGIWHFVNILNLTTEALQVGQEWATWEVEPDPERCFTAVVYRGARPEPDDPVTLSLSNGGLSPAWTPGQAEGHAPGGENLGYSRVAVLSSGTEMKDGVSTPYVDVSASHGFKTDEWRGAVVLPFFTGDTFTRFVWKNTSTRFWLRGPAWAGGIPPFPGEFVTFSLLDPQSLSEVAARAVGQAFFMNGIPQICGAAKPFVGFQNKGFCGEASVVATGSDGVSRAKQYDYHVKFPTEAQQGAGFCDPVLFMAAKPKEPLSTPTVVFWHQPPGSMPKPQCGPQPAAKNAGELGGIDVQVSVSRTKLLAPTIRVPASILKDEVETSFRGPAYSADESKWDGGGKPVPPDWGVVSEITIDDPHFVDVAKQGDGITKACEAILALFGQRAFLWRVRFPTPWEDVKLPQFLPFSETARFAGLSKRMTLVDPARETGFSSDTTTNLPIYSVTWEIEANATTLLAGTMNGWVAADAQAIAERFTLKSALKATAEMVKSVEDFRNKSLGKDSSRAGGDTGGPVEGCNVTVQDTNTRTVKSVEVDDENKKAAVAREAGKGIVTEMLFGGGLEASHPGAPAGIPGYDGDAAQQIIDPASAQLGPLVRHDLPFQGTPAEKNGARGTYGGAIETDKALSGRPSDQLWKASVGSSGVIIRLKKDRYGQGVVGAEWAPLAGDGTAGGPYQPLTKATDLPGGGVDLRWLAAGSSQRQIRDAVSEIVARMAALEDDRLHVLQPGDVTTKYPDGVPADLLSTMRVAGAFGSVLRVVPETVPGRYASGDPGGIVFQGPINDDGVDAGLFWRVMAPEMVLAQVVDVGAGAGTNGGRWDWDTSGPGGSTMYATSLGIVHKQADAKDLSDDSTQPARSSPAVADSPFCAIGQSGRVLPATDVAGAAAVLTLPCGSVGVPIFTARFAEELDGPAQAAGDDVVAEIVYSYRRSPWSAPASAGTGTALTSDGTNTGTGQFRAPGGAVPPGLRQPTDVAISVRVDPGAGSYAGNAVVQGIGVDVAVIQGGYAIRIRENASLEDTVVHTIPMVVEQPVFDEDEVAFELTKAIPEDLSFLETVDVEVNPPVVLFDEWEADDDLAFELTKVVGDGVSFADEVATELNPP